MTTNMGKLLVTKMLSTVNRINSMLLSVEFKQIFLSYYLFKKSYLPFEFPSEIRAGHKMCFSTSSPKVLR